MYPASIWQSIVYRSVSGQVCSFSWELVVADGFETKGYYAALGDPRLKDVEIDFVDLNLAEVWLVEVPGGGWARDEYWTRPGSIPSSWRE